MRSLPPSSLGTWPYVIAGSLAWIVSSAHDAGAAEPETATLTYRATSETASCPDEESFQHKVAARLGYEPFVAAGKHRVVVVVEARPNKSLVARAEVTRAGDPRPRVRELTGTARDCEALVDALATTVAIAIDPARGLGPAPAAPPPPAPAPVPAPMPAPPAAPVTVDRAAPPPPEPRAPSPPILVFARAGGVVSAGTAPGSAVGAEAGIGARREAFSLELSARFETMPGSVRVASGDRLEATVLSGTLAPCGELGVLVACAFGRVGGFQGRAPDVVAPSLGTTVFGAVGLRAGVRLPLWRWLAVQAMAEAGLPLVRTSLLIGPTTVWTAPPAFGGGSVSLVVLFP